jgi:L-fuculose-phosphate aldolase
MENHGTVVGGSNLFKAYKRFEIFEFTARSIINSQRLGKTFSLSEQQLQAFETQDNLLPEAVITNHPSDEKSIRFEICKYVKRACEQKLMISSYGTVSMRWHDNDFLITATGVNRRFIDLEDIVQIKNGHREKGKFPSRSVRHHLEIYQRNPDINCIIFTQSPNAMAFSISHREFETRTIPESYVLLKDINTIPYGDQFKKGRGISHFVSKENPLVIIENDSILVTGNTILETFDRLEVAEFSARSLIESTTIGSMVPMNEQEIEDLKKKFLT